MRRCILLVALLAICALAAPEPALAAPPARSPAPANLLANGGFESGPYAPGNLPTGWAPDSFAPSASFTWDDTQAHSGRRSVRISAPTPNDARWIQTVAVTPNTFYILSGWIKAQAVEHSQQAVDAGANLSLMDTWTRTSGVIGTSDWTYVSLVFNSGESSQITIGARLGYWSGTTTGTVWFDDLRLVPADLNGPHPRWKILVLIYGQTDFTYTDSDGVAHHIIATMTQSEREQAAAAATAFVTQDIPALTSNNMIPLLTIRYPERALTALDPHGEGWWPSPANTAPERDPAFDAVIVIWDPRGTDQTTGQYDWIGSAAGLTPAMGVGQTYTTLIIEAAISYGHRNVFKHEWGHSILEYFDAAGTAPKPRVDNHAQPDAYVHCPTGAAYIWVDETDASPIPNSIYNNESGFTHDYYSGTVAAAAEPGRCLGITPQAWALGGPVSKPGDPLALAPAEELRALRATIRQLVSDGALSPGRGRALQTRLDAAMRSLSREHWRAATHQLQAFVRQVEALVRRHDLDRAEGQALIDRARGIILALEDM